MPFVEELPCQPSFGVSVEGSHVHSAVVAFKLERTCNRGRCLRPKRSGGRGHAYRVTVRDATFFIYVERDPC